MAHEVEVYQGSVSANTKVELKGAKVTVALSNQKKSEYLGGRGVVYINEQANGRDIILRVPNDLRSMTARVARNRRNPVAGHLVWWAHSQMQNLSESYTDNSHHARLPGRLRRVQWDRKEIAVYETIGGFEYRFRTSTIGGDKFTIILQMTGGKLEHSQAIELTVRKRIRFYAIGMRTAPGQGLFDSPRTLARARKYYLSDFGIDLTPIGGTHTVPHIANPNTQQLRNHLVTNLNFLQNWNQLGNRRLCIVTVDRLAGGAAGRGGGNLVVLAAGGLRQRFNNYRNWQTGWVQARRAGHTLAQFLAQNNIPVADQPFYEWLVEGGADRARRAVQVQVFTTMIHEIGHALGLVPSNREAGGLRDNNWWDAQHASHCTERDCAMWWQVDLLAAVPSRRLASQRGKWFFHYERITERPSRCALYLSSCDLADIRSYPS